MKFNLYEATTTPGGVILTGNAETQFNKGTKEKTPETDKSFETEFYKKLNSNKDEDIEAALEMFVNKISKENPTQFEHINSKDPNNNYLSQVLQSLDKYGLDPNRNQLLGFALDSKNSFDKPASYINTISKSFEQKLINKNTDWLHTPEAYNGSPFKLKTLIFLSSNKAKAYGDNPQDIINEVLYLQDDIDIKRTLNGWQNKAPETADEKAARKVIDAAIKAGVKISDEQKAQTLKNLNA